MSRPDIVLVAARADNGVIGKDGAMPWHLPADLKHFKALTVGKPCIMGRRTFGSMGGALPGRHNIVMTRDPEWSGERAHVAANLAEAIAEAGLNPKARADEIMIIGGAEIYALALPSATRLELTEVHARPEGDTFFPEFDISRWREIRRERHAGPDGQPDFSFVTWERA
ncbi:dihydrofolate reductase [Pacificimonas sp. WHA3]|uniref:Dihydrofolate reductase n=1 Tax=Pacificimonas pallii TaxID=2827236 RepID=A0ABS6SBM9_9SPHN|nr:dihydrofolate reductase [Pacificimonas pallii]MBV7255630.1 dihydrofolate reductase [Pacificimonas pallii]